jgi:hypothetical protein
MTDAPQEVLAVFVETPIFVEIGIFVFASVMCVLFVVAVIKGANDKEWAKDQRMLAERGTEAKARIAKLEGYISRLVLEIETTKAEAARVPHSRGLNPRVKALKETNK